MDPLAGEGLFLCLGAARHWSHDMLAARTEGKAMTSSSGNGSALMGSLSPRSPLQDRIVKIGREITPKILWKALGTEVRCRRLMPGGMARRRFMMGAVGRCITGRPEPMLLRSPLIPGPVYVRPFTSDLTVAVELFSGGDYEVVRELVRSAATILDLGANIGLSVRLFRTWYPDARILALEPNPDTAAVARMNIDATGNSESIQLIEAAVAPAAGTIHFSTEDEPWAHHIVDRAGRSTIEVPAITVGQCLERMEASRIDLCKCDIEGGEIRLFADCRSWIGRVKHLVVETHPPYDVEKLETDLRRNGAKLMLRHKVAHGPSWLAFFSVGMGG